MLFPAIFPRSARAPGDAHIDLADEHPTGRALVRTVDGTVLWASGAGPADVPAPTPRPTGHGDATGED